MLLLSYLTSYIPTKSNLYLLIPWSVQVTHVPIAEYHVPLTLLRLYQRISPGLRQLYPFHNKARFYGELLAPHPIPQLEDHPLSAVRDCLFNIFSATRNIAGHSSICNLRTCHALVTGTSFHGQSDKVIRNLVICHLI